MRPGERIQMIIKSAENLASRNWGEAWLICREFGFKVDDPDYGNPDSGWWMYVLQQSERGDLPGLCAYLSGGDALPQPTGKWATVPLLVFLSHLYDRRDFAARLQMCLQRYGIESFVAHNDIAPSKAWRDEIKLALASCHAFAALLHDGFHKSQWCDQEVGWALARNIPIVPVRFPDSGQRDGFLADFQDVKMTREDAGSLSRQIFTALFNDSRTHDAGIRPLVEAFVNSSSFDMTRWLWGLIAAEPHLEPEQLRRLEYAVSSNRQVYEAVTREGTPVPELVGKLVKRHESSALVSADPWAKEPPF